RCKTWDAVVLAETSNLASHVLVRLQEILTFFAFDTNHFIAAILEMKNLFIVCRVHRHRALYSCFGAVRVELTRHVLTSRTQRFHRRRVRLTGMKTIRLPAFKRFWF